LFCLRQWIKKRFFLDIFTLVLAHNMVNDVCDRSIVFHSVCQLITIIIIKSSVEAIIIIQQLILKTIEIYLKPIWYYFTRFWFYDRSHTAGKAKSLWSLYSDWTRFVTVRLMKNKTFTVYRNPHTLTGKAYSRNKSVFCLQSRQVRQWYCSFNEIENFPFWLRHC